MVWQFVYSILRFTYRKQSIAVMLRAVGNQNRRNGEMKGRGISVVLIAGILLCMTACGQQQSSSETSSQSVSAIAFPDSSSQMASVSSEQSAQSADSSHQAVQSPTSSRIVTRSNKSTPSKNSSHQSSSRTSPRPSSSQTPSQVLQTVKITIPEGYTFMQIAQALEKKGVCSQKDFYTAAQKFTVQSFNVPSSPDRCFKLEGYLYPDTYEFYQEDDPNNVLRKMLNNYWAKSGRPENDVLILASILERETRSTEQMRMVASVFYNRLKAGMRLDSDPTREYVNQYITGNALIKDQSKYAPLYNTYKRKGLPAGPICNPSARAINAAKNPAESEYLYFFFGKDNQNHFSKTLEEHNQQMEEFGVQYQ